MLPESIDPVDFDERYRLDPSLWRDAIAELCAVHSLPVEPYETFPDGSNLIASVGGRWIVKVYPRFHRDQWESERRVLAHFDGRRLSCALPGLRTEGELAHGWTYVVVERLSGVLLERVWPDLTHREKASILEDIGLLMAEVHAAPVGELRTLEPRWPDLLASQVAGCRARHLRHGMPSWLTSELDRFVSDALPLLPAFEPVVLTGEYTPFNLLIDERRRLIGMFDFGDAMVGFREYDLLGPSVFLAGGDGALVRSLFRGYGVAQDESLRRRLMALMLLHRYANLRAQIRIPGWQERARSLDELERLIWPDA